MISLATQRNIDLQMEEMLENRICRNSQSPWSSPVILIAKKDCDTGFANNFRSLNSITHKDSYHIPNPRNTWADYQKIGSSPSQTVQCQSFQKFYLFATAHNIQSTPSLSKSKGPVFSFKLYKLCYKGSNIYVYRLQGKD